VTKSRDKTGSLHGGSRAKDDSGMSGGLWASPVPWRAGRSGPLGGDAAPVELTHKKDTSVSKRKAWLIIGAVVVVGIVVASSHKSKDSSSSAESFAAEPVAATTDAVMGQVSGSFHRDCLLCDGPLKSRIETSDVWCGWQGGDVIVHVTMTNNSVEHVTVNWHPSYTIAGGGEHGTGLSAEESDGFDAGETRELESHQSPEGVASGSAIGVCKPSFSTIDSG
jgi:hypothetical protein